MLNTNKMTNRLLDKIPAACSVFPNRPKKILSTITVMICPIWVITKGMDREMVSLRCVSFSLFFKGCKCTQKIESNNPEESYFITQNIGSMAFLNQIVLIFATFQKINNATSYAKR